MDKLIERVKRLGEIYNLDVGDYICDLESFGDEEVYEGMSDEDIMEDIKLYNINK